MKRRSPGDPARGVAFTVLRAVNGAGAYPNIELSHALRDSGLMGRDAALTTELVNGTCRLQGTYDRIIVKASGRALTSLQPAVVDLLRLGTHQLVGMRIPVHAAVAATVDLARSRVGERVTGLVNAVLRKVAVRDLDGWVEVLSAGESGMDAVATRTHHPRWIVDAYAEVLPRDELEAALRANNVPAKPTLVCRPGVTTRDDLEALGASPCQWSPFGAHFDGVPSELDDVRSARIGVQDEGSQLIALALARAAEGGGPLAGHVRWPWRKGGAASRARAGTRTNASCLRCLPAPRPPGGQGDGGLPSTTQCGVCRWDQTGVESGYLRRHLGRRSVHRFRRLTSASGEPMATRSGEFASPDHPAARPVE